MKDRNNEDMKRLSGFARLVAITETARLSRAEEEIERILLREQEARLSAEVLQNANLALTQNLSLERALEILLDALRKLVPYASANVMLVEEDSRFVANATKGYETFLNDVSLVKASAFSPKTNALFEEICTARRSLLVPDTDKESSWQRVPGSEHIRTWIGVPLISQDEVVGLFSLDHTEPGYFTAQHVRKAELLSAPAATAIQNAQLFRQSERNAAELTQRIAESKRVEEVLRLSESQLAEAQHLAHVGSWNWDIDTDSVTWSDELYRIFGLQPREFPATYQGFLDRVHPEDRELVARTIQESVSNHRPYDQYRRIIRPDGEVRVLHTRARVVCDEQGKASGLFGASQDVTERERAESAQHEAEEKYRDILDNVEEGVFQSSPEGKFITVNRAMARMLGFESPKELIAERTDIEQQHYVDPEGRKEFKRRLEKLGMVRGFELEAYRKDGSKIWMSENVRSVRDKDGRTLYYEGTSQDITERRFAEEALREAERRYRDIFENAREGIFQSTPDGRYIAANPALARMHGFDSPEELIRERNDISRQIYVDPARREEFKRLLHDHGVVRGFVHEVFRKDGSKICISVNARVVRDELGGISYYEGTAQDITERTRAEAAQRESEERYRDLVENSRELICTHDLEGLILSANRAALEAAGYAPADFIGKRSIRDILAPEVRHEFDEYLETIRRHGVARGIMFVQTSSGERRIWKYHNTVRTEGVAAPIVRGMARDITEQRRAEDALRESEERYRELFENAKDAIYVHDLSGRYTSVNRAAERLVGFTRDQILGKTFRDFVAPEHVKEVRKNLCRKLDEESETTYEIDVITRDDRRVPVEVSSRLVYENGLLVGVQGTVRDISERKRAQEARQSYSHRLIEAQETERQRIARELHDQLGQVLTALKLNMHSLQDKCSDREAWPHIEENVKIIDEALEQVRNLAVDLRPLLLDDLGLVTALRWYVERQAQRTHIRAEFINELPDADVRFSYELETACFRIAQEALTNVVRHSHADKVSLRLLRNGTNLILLITDDGVGFDVRALRNPAAAAATLGLRGMEERAYAVGGRIEIESAKDTGTRVRVQLPIAGPKTNARAEA